MPSLCAIRLKILKDVGTWLHATANLHAFGDAFYPTSSFVSWCSLYTFGRKLLVLLLRCSATAIVDVVVCSPRCPMSEHGKSSIGL